MEVIGMGEERLEDKNVAGYELLIPPVAVKMDVKRSEQATKTIMYGRSSIEAILDRKDKRKIVFVGPCSVHDTDEALEYANLLKELSDKVGDKILVVMRTYFEKPRSDLGWEGLVYDPDVNGSFKIEEGIRKARQLMLDISELGLPCATEFVDTIIPQYIDDMVSYAAIGARTIESPSHRRMCSGLSVPVGLKNNTNGDIDSAIGALVKVTSPGFFVGVDKCGHLCKVETLGNSYARIILRGGNGKKDETGKAIYVPNYDAQTVAKVQSKLSSKGMPAEVIIDCSHGNSKKDYKNQPIVFEDVIGQIAAGNNNILGLMLESYINAGGQNIPKNINEALPGISITDACIDFPTTKELLLYAHRTL
jgi:3-deoxy-7-phosphoheptulonate synthase